MYFWLIRFSFFLSVAFALHVIVVTDDNVKDGYIFPSFFPSFFLFLWGANNKALHSAMITIIVKESFLMLMEKSRTRWKCNKTKWFFFVSFFLFLCEDDNDRKKKLS